LVSASIVVSWSLFAAKLSFSRQPRGRQRWASETVHALPASTTARKLRAAFFASRGERRLCFDGLVIFLSPPQIDEALGLRKAPFLF